MFTFDQLRAFTVVAEELHFGRAAERLRMTQPPLSRQIQKLEQALGAVLFTRGSRQVTLTPAGQAFLGEARRLLALAATAPVRARHAADGTAGRLAIGFTATAALGLLGTLLREADELMPGVEIVLHELVTAEQVAQLHDGALDLGLARPLGVLPELRAHLVHRERLVVALHVDHRLSHEPGPVAVGDLRGTQMITYSADFAGYFRDLVSSVLASVEVRPSQQVSQVHSMIALVAAGRGIALVPESVSALVHHRVVFRPLAEWQQPLVQLHAVWSPDSANPALLRAVQELPALRPLATN